MTALLHVTCIAVVNEATSQHFLPFTSVQWPCVRHGAQHVYKRLSHLHHVTFLSILYSIKCHDRSIHSSQARVRSDVIIPLSCLYIENKGDSVKCYYFYDSNNAWKTPFFVTVLWKVSFNISWCMLLHLSSASMLMKQFFLGKIKVFSSLKNTNILEDGIQVDHRHNIDVSFIQIMIFNRQLVLIFNSTFN